MPRSEFLLIVVLIILSASIGLVLAHTPKDFVEFRLCSLSYKHNRNNEPVYLRKNAIVGIKPSAEVPTCSMIAIDTTARVRVHGTPEELIELLEDD